MILVKLILDVVLSESSEYQEHKDTVMRWVRWGRALG